MAIEPDARLETRARVHSALGEPVRLAIADQLTLGDASPGELGQLTCMPANLLAHHLRVLEEAGLIRRVRSEGDGRRSYVQLAPSDPVIAALVAASTVPAAPRSARRVVFVCTQNSARSQLARAAWAQASPVPVTSAGTHPAARIHRRAVMAGLRHGYSLHGARTARVQDVLEPGDLVVAVCDNAYEDLSWGEERPLHWSIPDPARADTAAAFDLACDDIGQRIRRLASAVSPPAP